MYMEIFQMFKWWKMDKNSLILDRTFKCQKPVEKKSKSNLELLFVQKIGSKTHTLYKKKKD